MEERRKFLVFSIGRIRFGIPLLDVIRVVDVNEIPKIVKMKDSYVSISDDKFMAVVDLRKKFKIKGNDVERQEFRAVITIISGIFIGLLLDSNIKILALSDSQLVSVPELLARKLKSNYLLSIATGLEFPVLIIDKNRMFSINEMNRFADGISRAAAKTGGQLARV